MGSRNPDYCDTVPNWHEHKTLGQLKKAGFQIRSWCKKCGHDQVEDIDRLIELRGTEGVPWDCYRRCEFRGCGGRAVFKARATIGGSFHRLSRNWSGL
ncbi:MAG: hypothetical protein JWP92_3755 [Caulobacter sp.]|nr:hypothetical protein [Caulobacter sp.]